MIRQVLSESANIIYGAISLFLFLGVFLGIGATLIQRKKSFYKKHEELPFHESTGE